jgi:hypothetical protein
MTKLTKTVNQNLFVDTVPNEMRDPSDALGMTAIKLIKVCHFFNFRRFCHLCHYLYSVVTLITSSKVVSPFKIFRMPSCFMVIIPNFCATS